MMRMQRHCGRGHLQGRPPPLILVGTHGARCMPPEAAAAGGEGPPAPRRRRRVPGRRPPARRADQPPPSVSDEELVRELNSAHTWLPGEEGASAPADAWGLEDVGAYAAHQQARCSAFTGLPVDRLPGAASRLGYQAFDAGGGGSGGQGGGSGLPGWYGDLEAAGFGLVTGTKGSDVFLQRRSGRLPAAQPAPQQPPDAGEGSDDERGGSSDQGGSRQGAVGSSGDGRQAGAGTTGAGVLRNLVASLAAAFAVGPEFQPAAWPLSPARPRAAAARGAATGLPVARASGGRPVDTTWLADVAGTGSSSKDGSPGAAPGSLLASPAAVQRAMLLAQHPDELTAWLDAAFPAWAANGCRLVHQGRGQPVPCPTPGEAAQMIKGLALASRRAGYTLVHRQSLARDRHVQGLAECLRVTPPRLPGQPEQQQPGEAEQQARRVSDPVAMAAWQAARSYWRPQALPPPVKQPAGGPPPAAASAGSSSSGSSSRGLPGASVHPPHAAALAAGAAKLAPEQATAALRLLAYKQVQRARCAAFVAALWGLAVVGGPDFFEAEVEALLQVATPAAWQFTGAELADSLWALAHARHWTPKLSALADAVAAAGGLAALPEAQATSALWAFATLGHVPAGLLTGLDGAWGGAQGGQALVRLSEVQLTTVLWSLAALQRCDGAACRAAWTEAGRRGGGGGWQAAQLAQLWQAALALRLEAGWRLAELPGWGPGTEAEQLLGQARAAFQAATAAALRRRGHSSYQRGIANALTALGVMHQLEDVSSGYAVDITLPGQRTAIEADGPTHMARNADRPLGGTAMKARHLAALGWAVVNVGYRRWDALGSDPERRRWLAARLQQARGGGGGAGSGSAAGGSA